MKELAYSYQKHNRGIKHDFPFIDIRKDARAKPEVFNTSRETLRMLMNDKIMFDRYMYYCINPTKPLQKRRKYYWTLFYTAPKVSFTVTRVRCILGIKKNDGNIDGMIKTQGKRQRLPIESPVADCPINNTHRPHSVACKSAILKSNSKRMLDFRCCFGSTSTKLSETK